MNDDKQKLIFAIGAGLISAVVAYKLYKKSSLQPRVNGKPTVQIWKAVGVVESLHIYPIKSCQGIQVKEAEAQTVGLVHGELIDRYY